MGVVIDQYGFSELLYDWIVHYTICGKNTLHKASIEIKSSFSCLQDQVAIIVPPVLRLADFTTFFPDARQRCNILHYVKSFVFDFLVILLQLFNLLRGEYIFNHSESFLIKIFQVLGYVSVLQVFIARSTCTSTNMSQERSCHNLLATLGILQRAQEHL